jgi:molybdate transport system substrate-binding protein
LVLSASSAQEAVRAVADDLPGETQVAAGGSSALVRQLQSGARADVLITADERTMSAAVDAGLVATAPTAIASARLALAVPSGAQPTSPAQRLTEVDFTDVRLVLCSPPVPCGAAAEQALSRAGIDPEVSSYEPNSRQTLAKVALGVADAALVWNVDLHDEPRVRAEYPGLDLPTTTYYAAVTKGASRPEQARAFITSLTSAAGQATLHSFGFTTAGSAATAPSLQGSSA